MCYVICERKRDNQIVLSFNMIYWDYKTVILAFCNDCILFTFFSAQHSWLLQQGNETAHNTLRIRQFLTEKNISVLEKNPYSPDLAPRDLFYIRKGQVDN